MKRTVTPLLVLVGIILTMYYMLMIDVWLDEASTFFIATPYSFTDLLTARLNPTHNFLYYIFMKLWLLVNTSQFFFRLPSLIASCVSMIFIHKSADILGKQFRLKNLSAITLLLYIFYGLHITYGFMAIEYVFMQMFFVLSLFNAVEYFRTREKKYLLYYCICNVLGYCTGFSYIWGLISSSVFLTTFFLFRKIKLSSPFVITHGTLSLFVLILFIIHMSLNYQGVFDRIIWISKPDTASLTEMAALYLGFFTADGPFQHGLNILSGIAIVSACVYLIMKKNRQHMVFCIALFLSFTIPLLLSYTVSITTPFSIFLDRSMINLGIPILLLLSLLFAYFITEGSYLTKTMFVLYILAYAASNAISSNEHLNDINNSDAGGRRHKDAAVYLRQNAHLLKYYPALIIPDYNQQIFEYYYYDYDKNPYGTNIKPYRSVPEEQIASAGTFYLINPSFEHTTVDQNGRIASCLKTQPIRYKSARIYRCEDPSPKGFLPTQTTEDPKGKLTN